MVQVVIEEEFHHIGLLSTLEVPLFAGEEFFLVRSLLDFNSSLVLGTVIKRTFKAFEAFGFFTRLSFVNQRMELLFLPAMTIHTTLQSFASFFITSNECAALPVFAEFCIIFEQIGFPSVILEVVCIDTLCFVMIMVERAPFCFEVEDVEIEILIHLLHMMNQTHFDIFNRMSE